MLKLIITSDWHIGNSFHNYDREKEFNFYFKQLKALIEVKQPDALLVCGDIFDNANPSAAAQAMYYQFLYEATEMCRDMKMIIIAGNHDSAYRLEAPKDLMAWRNIYVIGLIDRDTKGNVDFSKLVYTIYSRSDKNNKVNCLAIPYLKRGDIPSDMSYSQAVNGFIKDAKAFVQANYENSSLILIAHLYAHGSEIADGSSERIIIGGEEQVDVKELGTGITYTALGHIHKRQRVCGLDNVRYCGSALPMSFSEKKYKHGVDFVCIDKNGKIAVEHCDFELLRPLKIIPEEAKPWEEVEKIIEELPNGEIDDHASYLQLNIFLDAPQPDLNIKVQKALQNKNVRLCRIVPSYPPHENSMEEISSIDELRDMDPLKLLKQIYVSRHKVEMDENMENLANQAIKEAQEEVGE